MMKHLPKQVLIVIGIVAAVMSAAPPVRASTLECSGSIDRHSVSSGSSLDYTVTVKNDSPDTNVLWIRVTRHPSSNFTVNSAQNGQWNGNASPPDSATYTGAGLSPGSDTPVTFNATAGDITSSENWIVEVSASDQGGSTATCNGDFGTEITAAAPSAPSIFDIVVSGISDTKATITWTTDVAATSVVNYGTTAPDYGSTSTDTSYVTAHSRTITGLTANTTYHYDITSARAEGQSNDSGDNTFVTAIAGTTTTTTTTGSVRTVTATPTPTPRPDTSPPRVTVTTDFTKPFAAAPTIKGTATDPSGVGSLEYSLDNGKSWLPVETIAALGKTSTTFSFTPESLFDDNYQLKIRAADLKGNTGETPIGTLVIDRLPPMIGGNVASLGPQILSPTSDGSYVVPVGLDVKLTLSAVGGSTSIDLSYPKNPGELVKIPLKKNFDNGLWSGILRFDAAGTYIVTARAIDGAGNRGERDIASIVAVESGKVTSGAQAVRSGSLTVYYLDNVTKRFVVWDGSSYGQVNPQPLTLDGQYTLYLPAGTYYLDVSAPGYRSLVTNMFTVTQGVPITTNFSLLRARALRIFSWFIPLPDFRQTVATVTVGSQSQPTVTSALVGHEFPYFSLIAKAKTITSFDLRGKPTIVTFLNTWLPATTTQMAILNDVAKKKDINVLVIIPQETASSVYIFGERGQYSVPIAADPDGELVEPLNLHSLPTHIVVDRKGSITAVVSGVLTKEELLDELIQ